MKHFLACFIGLLLLSIHSKAQNDVDKTVYTVDTQIPSYIYMKDSKIGSHLLKTSSKKVDTADFLKRILNLNEETVAVLSDTLTDFNGGFHKFYTEYYKGIKVEGSRYGIHYDKQGVIKSMNGNFRSIDTLNIVPNITETDAIEVALNHVGATEYAWQNKEEENMLKVARGDFNATYKPTGEILIYFSNNKPFLVYVFNIKAIKPFSLQRVYIDAHDGRFVDSNSLCYNLENAEGIAYTRYSGKRNIITTKTDYGYILYDTSRGNGIKTINMLGDEYYDNDNIWTDAEWNNSSLDNAALDIHWGIEQTYDYFLKKFGRNSYDNNGSLIKSIVNVKSLKDNARWDGLQEQIEFGITTGNNPVACLDIVAHELSHAITLKTCNLIYKGESGALNEGFSDIWGICVEKYAKPENSANDIWRLGEATEETALIRDIKSPACKYYGGTGWGNPLHPQDYGYVHTNSGVLTYWFYTLVNGGSCDGNPIIGIGFDKAEKICYQTLTTKLTSNSTYKDAKINTIDVAEELYGKNSEEVIAIKNAWYSVGVLLDKKDTFIKTTISGPTLLHEEETATYKIENAPSGIKFNLGGLQFVSFDGHNLVVKANCKARAYINIDSQNNGTYAMYPIWVGVPIISNVYYNAKDNLLEANTFGGDAHISNTMWSVDGGGYSIYPNKYRPYKTHGTVSISVRASNSCGTGPDYNCQLTLNNNGNLSISQAYDLKIISILSDLPEDIGNNVNYRLLDAKSGNCVKSGKATIGDELNLQNENKGLYLLELKRNAEQPVSFKIMLK